MNPKLNIQPLREVSLPYGNLRSQLLDGAILFRGNIMEEIWKPIKGYEGLYEVSNLGRVKSLARYVCQSEDNQGGIYVEEKLLNPQINSDGYYNVRLYKDGPGKTLKVHCLVWDHFSDVPRNGIKLQIDHIDNNKQNNKFDNLQLLTSRGNISKARLLTKNNRLLPTGVYWNKTNRRYYAHIHYGGKTYHLGTFGSIEEASQAYQQKLKEVI